MEGADGTGGGVAVVSWGERDTELSGDAEEESFKAIL